MHTSKQTILISLQPRSPWHTRRPWPRRNAHRPPTLGNTDRPCTPPYVVKPTEKATCPETIVLTRLPSKTARHRPTPSLGRSLPHPLPPRCRSKRVPRHPRDQRLQHPVHALQHAQARHERDLPDHHARSRRRRRTNQHPAPDQVSRIYRSAGQPAVPGSSGSAGAGGEDRAEPWAKRREQRLPVPA